MFYAVDFGLYTQIMMESEVHKLYDEVINKTEYPFYDVWMYDMKRMGLVRELNN